MKLPVALLALLISALHGAEDRQEPGDELVLMTFNIRYGTAEDGPNGWGNRRSLVAEIIRHESPDVVAIQEGLAFQLEDLEDVLGGYRKLGQHREGGSAGEFSGLYVNEARVTVLRWGEFWLSPTPDSVGSRGWDAALPRMAVWVELEGTASTTSSWPPASSPTGLRFWTEKLATSGHRTTSRSRR